MLKNIKLSFHIQYLIHFIRASYLETYPSNQNSKEFFVPLICTIASFQQVVGIVEALLNIDEVVQSRTSKGQELKSNFDIDG